MDDCSLMRLPKVMQKTSLGRSYIYHLIKQGEFPQPVKVGPRSVAWVESEVNDWIANKITQRDGDR
ncbi:prophage regulatory protein [Erwinia toletana]|uniref:Prophage regulatory protein n=1 Tax=Winslowiella toletana TaxID=92490 RepID=A0ABS4P5N1_9GAMM|nr:AlpA family transcriptional regulator [Winslowiella toletana]MBP2167952.1 prophage regulatory protein [Winslowiella toletana]